MSLHLYSFFHLNLAYSAIEEEDRSTVIERCYWPLLRLARRRGLPLGIELSGYTLETIDTIDPAWVIELQRLINDGPCELIGCGYSQIIGPLAPPEVTLANLRIGHQIYERLLGCRPTLALLNEQAYAAGLIPLYQESGYRAIIMEWDNPAREHPEWVPGWRYLPQLACGPGDARIPLIWNKSIAFQKFQRYVHGEIELGELLGYVESHLTGQPRAFPLYGNDAEIFDFRPGRYMTEAPLHDDGEWARIDRLFEALQAAPGICLIPPSKVLDLLDRPGAANPLRLETAAQPTPVKKQDKYNLVRWAVSGRDDLNINTRCFQVYEEMLTASTATDLDWQELCYLWSSDFRTHITSSRWQSYRTRLERFAQRWLPLDKESSWIQPPLAKTDPSLRVERRGKMLEINGRCLKVRLNCLRGLALDAFVDRRYSEQSLCGTLQHGYYDDIRWGADYYSGHLILETPGRPKVTDLNAIEPQVVPVDGGLCIAGSVPTPLGPIEKRWWVDDCGGRLILSLRFNWKEAVFGSLRLGHITLNPNAFDITTLRYRTHNGGRDMETFTIQREEISHGRAISFLVSANHAVGMTDGIIELGDTGRRLQVRCKRSQAALVAMVTHQRVRDSYFTRLAFSAREADDTSHHAPLGALTIDLEISVVE